MSKTFSPRVLLLVSLLLLCTTAVAMGQSLGPEAFGLVSRFGAAAPVPTRELGMGVPIACVNDVQYANPAFAALGEQRDVALRFNTTTFEVGPVLNSLQLSYTHPLPASRSGWQIGVIDVYSQPRRDVMMGILGPARVDMEEQAFVVDYGRTIAPKLSVGLSVLGAQRVTLDFTSSLAPVNLFSLEATADYGFRGGVAYEWAPGDFLAASYMFSQHRVWTDGLIAGGVPTRHILNDDLLAIGASRHLTPEVMLLAEYHLAHIRNGETQTTKAWHFGGEWAPAPGRVALRAGFSDGQPTMGMGYRDGAWQIDYAWLRDWNYGGTGLLFGSSETSSMEVAYTW